MGLKKEVPDWKNAGIEPSENLKSEGHKAGVKPPASLFNWFWYKVSEFLSEIKERVYTKDETYTKGEVDVSIAKKADKNLFENHTSNKNNPHSVDKIQVGLSNVDNSKQATKAEFDSHVASKTNPHSVTKVQVGLSNVDNTQQATKAEFNSHNTDTTKHITDTERINWNSKATGDHSHNFSEIKNVPSASSSISGITRLVDSVVSSDISSAATPKSVKSAYDAAKFSEAQLNVHVADKGNPHGVSKAQVGLGNVDNIQQATKAEFNSHNSDTVRHITAIEKTDWNSKAPGKHNHEINDINELKSTLDTKQTFEDSGWIHCEIKNNADAYGTVRIINGVVYCRLNVIPKKLGTSGADTVALIIPEGYRPISGITYSVSSGVSNGIGQMQVAINGEVRMWTANNIGARYYLYTSWLIN
ncbi:tail fiber protein [Carnobacterium maltaromaticum]|uniref:tail fiber protein n=1 Tax=Carnobacterium maltaromaticum TaxID=2751 RepID=UPI0039BE04B0